MLSTKYEYTKMAEVELQHWWYRALHHLVLDSIGSGVSGKDVSIIDAGCGTGGLMMFLKEHGYGNLKGFDLSADAVEICRGRGLSVAQHSLLDIADRHVGASDVIVSNDTLYFLSESERAAFVSQCSAVLKPEGLLILNVPVFEAFSGIHDLSVGIRHRLSRREVQRLFAPDFFRIIRETYWPFLLSPLIYMSRLGQRIRMRTRRKIDVRSDIDMPGPWLNETLMNIVLFENRHIGPKPFGSSLFIVAKKI